MNQLKRRIVGVALLSALALSSAAQAVEQKEDYLSLGILLTPSLIEGDTVNIEGASTRSMSEVSSPKGINLKWRSTDRGNHWGAIYSLSTADKNDKEEVEVVGENDQVTTNEVNKSLRYLSFSVGPIYTFEHLSLYSLIGVTQLTIKESKEEGSLSKKDYALTLGMGASYKLNRNFSLDAHFEVPKIGIEGSNYSPVVGSVGVAFKF